MKIKLKIVVGLCLLAVVPMQRSLADPESSIISVQGALLQQTLPLTILLPRAGDEVGTRLAIIFETPANLTLSTELANGQHLHIESDDMMMMPVADQLIRLGGDRYLFVFDLPVKPGKRDLRIYWADGEHKPIESSIQKVEVTVTKLLGKTDRHGGVHDH
jgi:hypothetical protein